MNNFCIIDEFFKNYNWIIGLVVQGFIGYHIFVLSKRTNKKTELSNTKFLKEEARNIISEAYSSESNRKKVIIIDVQNIKKYPDGASIAGSIKGINYEGVEVYIPVTKKVFKTKHNKLTLKSKGNEFYCDVQLVGVIPYKWIEYIEPHGDEYNSCAGRIFCRFKSYQPYFKLKLHRHLFTKEGYKYLLSFNFWYFSPYNEIIYYIKNPKYNKATDYYWEEYHLFCKELDIKSIKLNK
jgi:hypothetical protein